jgi:pyridoxine 5-phosphate synthase
MTRLSVNINKFATIRNARDGNNPNLVQVARDCERFGAQGITVHPRPDERHIRYDDVIALSETVTTEFNIEGYPDRRYLDLVLKVKPAQATLVPDPPEAITSNAGWDTIKNESFLKEVIGELQNAGIRTSIFVAPELAIIEGAKEIGTDRIELYTEAYAHGYLTDKIAAIKPYKEASELAHQLGIGINAGHDLDLNNLSYLCEQIPYLEEVSIGHALVCDALYLGLENTIQMYLNRAGFYKK